MTTADEHLSTDQLADLAADALTPVAAVGAQAHLATCSDCRGTLDLLVELPSLLAQAPVDPIPADVTARVAAAIEREQIARAGEAEAAGSASGARSRPERATARRRFGARLGAGLLGTAAVLGGGYFVLDAGLLGGGDNEASPASQAESAPDVLDGGALPEEGADPPTAFALGDGNDYTSASLDEDVQVLLETSPLAAYDDADITSRAPEVPSDDGQPGEPGSLRAKYGACVAATQQAAGSDAQPVAIDLGTYNGVPAVVVVLPDRSIRVGSPDQLDVWVIDASCLDDAALSPADSPQSSPPVLEHRAVRR